MLAHSDFDRYQRDDEVERNIPDVHEKSNKKEKDKGKGIDESEKHNVALSSQEEGSRMELGMKLKFCGLFEEDCSQISSGSLVIDAEEPRFILNLHHLYIQMHNFFDTFSIISKKEKEEILTDMIRLHFFL